MTATKYIEGDPAVARKRRIQRVRAHRNGDDDDDDSSSASKRARLEDSEVDEEGRPKPSLRGIKKQSRYEPGVPMSKEELAAWRKEARRVRNRESAAASRQKTRERIEELEAQVTELQGRYDNALARIAELEGKKEPTSVTLSLPSNTVPKRVSPQASPQLSPVTSPEPPYQALSLDDLSEANLHHAASQLLLPLHDIHPSMISRPTAVCV
jgi:hypothetical protein